MLSKLERVERTLNLLPVDRVAIHDFIYNSEVISYYTGKKIEEFSYSMIDVCEVVRKTMDMWRPFNMITAEEDGFVFQHQGWTRWITKYPFNDTKSLKEYILKDIEKINRKIEKFDIEKERENYRKKILFYKKLVGDDTVMMSLLHAPLREYLWRAGISLFTYLYYDEPEVIHLCLQKFLEYQLKMIHSVADNKLSPVVLIPTEIGGTKAPLFNINFLRENLFPGIKSLSDAWHKHKVKVIVEIQGNCKALIEDFLTCGIDGFYAIESVASMDIVELKKKYPEVVWTCGIDGINLMSCGNTDEVRKEVKRQIEETDCLNTGGLFLGTSSEINPNIKVENYVAMVEEAISIRNKDFFF